MHIRNYHSVTTMANTYHNKILVPLSRLFFKPTGAYVFDYDMLYICTIRQIYTVRQMGLYVKIVSDVFPPVYLPILAVGRILETVFDISRITREVKDESGYVSRSSRQRSRG
jgi:hypothetical protein